MAPDSHRPITILMRLQGPMQSWGTQSRFTVRDTGLEPSKSGVIGLVCAALGRERQEPLDDLVSLRLGVRVDREGRVERDYQTAGGWHRRHETWYGVPTADGSGRRTVTSSRYYLADASFLVGLESPEPALANQITDGLRRPRWPLYLGRKSNVPASPVLEATTVRPLEEALGGHPWRPLNSGERKRAIADAKAGTPWRLRLILDADYGSTPFVRTDAPLSFAERQFALRYVRISSIELTETLIEEGSCISLE